MKIGVLGTGMVGQTIATKLASLDHEVRMGSREAGNEKAVAWAKDAGGNASEGSFAEAAKFGELVVNCTAGVASVDVLTAAGADNLAGKVLVDIANPLDASQGLPPTLAFCNDDSLGERIQAAFPEARVVKTLNTMNHELMVDPARVPANTPCSSAATTPMRRARSPCSWAASAGPRTGSSTSVASPAPAAPRCTCPCG
ncbi:MAG TPA: NAD(P)-binding domain-containing protein [Solirubrobacterales bacterium]|nr:NAD(P)-binding domain-containing protein [Solirubrobacterales bacterium]